MPSELHAQSPADLPLTSPVLCHEDDKGSVAPEHIQLQIKPLVKMKVNKWSVLAGGLGMFSDGYQNTVLSIASVLFQKIYGKSIYTSERQAQLANALKVGQILGEATFGFISDIVGRKTAVLITTGFLVLGGILGTAAKAPNITGFIWFLTIALGVSGFGSGGEYPAAQTTAVEGADQGHSVKNRGMVTVLATLGSLLAGQLMSYIVCLIALVAAHYDGTRRAHELHKLEIVWRVLWAFGIVAPLSLLLFRVKSLSTVLYKRNAIQSKVPYALFLRKYGARLLGTWGIFFSPCNCVCQQFINYPGGTFSGIIISSVAPKASLIQTVAWTLCLTSFSIPGTIVGAYCSRFLDRRVQIAIGFGGYMIFGVIIGALYDKVVKIVPLFVVLYGVYLSIGSFGLGNLAGLLVSEAFPTSMRGTAHGLIAALGKCGGICGNYAFTAVKARYGLKYTFIVSGCVAVVGIFFSLVLCQDTSRLSLEEVDQEWRAYLEEKGWAGAMGDVDNKHLVGQPAGQQLR